MAKQLTFVIDKHKIEAGIAKVDRDKVYGYVEERITDKAGKPCLTGNLLDDGQTLIVSGSTSLKTVDENGIEHDKKALKTVYLDGRDAVLVPSSYDGEIKLEKVGMEELFNLEVTAVYQLTWEASTGKAALLKSLENAAIYRFIFNYRADYEGADALLLSAQNEAFVLTGRLLTFDFLEPKTPTPVAEESIEESEEDMDFGML